MSEPDWQARALKAEAGLTHYRNEYLAATRAEQEARAGLEKAREALDMAQSALMAAAHRMRHEGFTEAADALDREASAALASLNTTADQGRPVPPHGRGP